MGLLAPLRTFRLGDTRCDACSTIRCRPAQRFANGLCVVPTMASVGFDHEVKSLCRNRVGGHRRSRLRSRDGNSSLLRASMTQRFERRRYVAGTCQYSGGPIVCRDWTKSAFHRGHAKRLTAMRSTAQSFHLSRRRANLGASRVGDACRMFA